MNKYQREKVKRMKNLAKLGVSYSCQKQIVRKYDLAQIDTMIEQINTIKNSGILEKMQRVAKHLGKALAKLIRGNNLSI